MIKKIITFLVLIIVIFSLYKFLSTPPKTQKTNTTTNTDQSSNTNTDLIFYYGNTCPHCKNVEDFIAQNKINEKLNISLKEVYENKNNSEELSKIVDQYCPDLNQNGIGVPLAFDPKNQKCIQGDTTIIDFLKQKIK